MAKTSMAIQSANRPGSWHALLTRYQHEKSVATALSNKSYEVYLPLYRFLRRWQDRAQQIWLPLFPCYLFVFGGIDRQRQIVTTPGVLNIVAWGGHPAVVPQGQMDAVRQIIESHLTIETHPYLQCGERVRVKTGPLMGIVGKLTRKKGVARLVISM
jgi:transcription antitermination factor NusG